ncbi:MAG: inositol monophosphatase family protein [Candidatus Aminicenantales bacterium]
MNLDNYLNEAKIAAKKAGQILRDNIDRAAKISFKGEVDLVTDFDHKAQNLIFDYLSGRFPEHDFLGEEGLQQQKGKNWRWIIDPLDGTTNYAHHFPVFCVSLALEWKREIVLGVVYDPMRDEMFSALKGQGAFLKGQKICVSGVDDLDKSLVATGFPYDLRQSKINNINHFNNFLLRVQAIRRCGSAAMDLCYVACGRFDGFWELKLKPWDMAAGALIVEEAGGQVSDFKNHEFSVFGSEIIATNGLIHLQMVQVLQLGNEKDI